jgi:hypothetical protein
MSSERAVLAVQCVQSSRKDIRSAVVRLTATREHGHGVGGKVAERRSTG